MELHALTQAARPYVLLTKVFLKCCSVLAVPCTLFSCEVMKSSGKLRPQSTSFTGGLHTPNMEVTTTTPFLYWWSTHTKYGSYDHNTLPLLVVYTHQIWKLRPHFPHWWSTHTKYECYDHTSPTGGLHTPNMEEGMTNNDTHDIPFTWYVTHTLPLQAYCDYTLAD